MNFVFVKKGCILRCPILKKDPIIIIVKMLLAYATAISGTYALANLGWNLTNRKLVKNNKLITLKGMCNLKKLNIDKEGIMYKLYTYDPQNSIKFGYWLGKIKIRQGFTFTIKTFPCVTFSKKGDMDFLPETKNYLRCPADNKVLDSLNILRQNSSFEPIILEYANVTKDCEIWVMINKNVEYKTMAKMGESDFKHKIILNNQLPLWKTNMIMFLLLLFLCLDYYYEL